MSHQFPFILGIQCDQKFYVGLFWRLYQPPNSSDFERKALLCIKRCFGIGVAVYVCKGRSMLEAHYYAHGVKWVGQKRPTSCKSATQLHTVSCEKSLRVKLYMYRKRERKGNPFFARKLPWITFFVACFVSSPVFILKAVLALDLLYGVAAKSKAYSLSANA